MKINQNNRTIIHTVGVASVIFFVFILIVNQFLGIRDADIESVILDDYIQVEVNKSDGLVSTYNSSYFTPAKKDDQIIAVYDLSETEFIQGAELSFILYHSQVRVFSGDELIYQQEPVRQGGQVGGVWYSIGLPDDYNEKPLRIEIDVIDYGSVSSLQNVQIVKSGNASYTLMAGRTGEFLLFSSLLILSLFMLNLLLFASIKQKNVIYYVMMAWFCVCATVWVLGNYQMFYLISNQKDFCAIAEYISLFMTPIPLSLYMKYRLETPVFKRIANIFLITFIFYFIATTAIHISPLEYTYSYFLRPLQILLTLSSTIYVVGLFYESRKGKVDNRILESGLAIAIVIALLDVVRFSLSDIFGDQYFWLKRSLSSYAVLVILITIILSFIQQYVDELEKRMKQKQLEALAFLDPLTTCPNRASCHRSIEEYKQRKVNDYIMFFVDLNGLKRANDSLGHDVGDRMICRTAKVLKECFQADGFYGRWGGDEFIACVETSSKEVTEYIDTLQKLVEEDNAVDTDHNPLSLSIGYVISTSQQPIDYLEAINLADNNMYEEKKKYYQSYQGGALINKSDDRR